LARIQTAELLKLGERQIAELIRKVESDPLFLKLLYPSRAEWKIVRFQPHPRTRLAGSFYELNENSLPFQAPADVVALLERNRGVLKIIQTLGRDIFERYFLLADEAMDTPSLAKRTGIRMEDVERLREFILDFSVQAEFFSPKVLPPGRLEPQAVRLAQLSVMADGDVAFEFWSPHLARGRYDIQYDHLQALLRQGGLTPEEGRRLKAFIHRLERINWRQNTLYRILELLCSSQRRYFKDRDTLKKIPLTQRQLARRLSVAPSTINRAIHNRSVILPWGEEILLENLFYGRKELCVDALGALEIKDKNFQKKTDEDLQKELKDMLSLVVPRRTLNTYRRLLEKKK
jgi:transcriptional regulator with XRE-family HTH domain